MYIYKNNLNVKNRKLVYKLFLLFIKILHTAHQFNNIYLFIRADDNF